MKLERFLVVCMVFAFWFGCGPERLGNDEQRNGDDDDSALGDDDSGDDDTGDDDSGDDDSGDDGDPFIVRLLPDMDSVDFFFGADLEVEWNLPPEGASLTLGLPGGASLSGTTEMTNSGRQLNFNPDQALASSTTHSVTVAWNGSTSPVAFDFQTGPHGEQLDTAAEQSLVGRVFNLDLAGATFVEPPGVGPILQSQMGDINLLFTVTAESNFDAAGQPGLHIVGAYGDVESGQVAQDLCSETLAFTYGADRVAGTTDDTPASWDNPEVVFGPTNLDMDLQGINTTMQDLNVTGTFHPDLVDTQGGSFSGRIDTRPLAPELDPDGGESAICELLVETVGVECEPCNEDGGEPFCLSVLAEDVEAEGLDQLTLVNRSCVDIITDYIADGSCSDSAEGYDVDENEDGALDGSYTGCAGWTP